jgi:hypothetical protein
VAFGQFSGSQAAFETIFKIIGGIWNNFQVQQAAFGKTFRITGGFRNHFQGHRRLSEQLSGSQAAFGTVLKVMGSKNSNWLPENSCMRNTELVQ